MTRGAFLKKYLLRFAVSLTLVGLMVYTIYHVFGNLSGNLMTTPARRITDLEIIDGEGYLFREESVLTVSSPGIICDLAESGSKVSRGGELVQVYGGYGADELSETQLELERLERMLLILEESRLPNGVTLSHADTYRSEAMRLYRLLCDSVTRGELLELTEVEDQMLILLNRYRQLTDPSFDLEAAAEELCHRRDELLRGEGTILKNEHSSGYFYRYDLVDGYESVFTLDALESLTHESFLQLADAEARDSGGFAVGKMVYGNRWYLVIGFDADAAEFLEADSLYVFTFPENGDRELSLSCTRLIEGADGGIVAVFASDEVPPDFVWYRAQTVEITVGSTTGYYVPDSAMYVVDGVEGVYVLEGAAVYFRRVEVLFRGDGYCVVAEQGDRGGDYLALNDVMVTSADDLYDGRVYR